MTGPRWGHAVVVGGAYAGLLTAHTLVEHFEQVTVCERDLVEVNTEFHPGVPQARHPHGVLARGAELLEARFPGLRAELSALGAPIYDFGLGLRFRLPSGRRLPVSAMGIEMQNVTRTTLERAIRQRVLAHPRIKLRAGFVVDGLTMDREAGDTVTGVVGRQRGIDSSPTPAWGDGHREHLPADFVVEATGRAAKLVGWLAEVGWERPEIQEIDGRISYVSQFFRLPTDHAADWYLALRLTYAPTNHRGGVATKVDGDRWLITLIGAGGEVPPTDPAGFFDYATSLGMEEIPAAIAAGTPLTPTYRFARIANRWICYHRLPRWPQRLIAIGDAVCVFNPVYGQGLTVAAQQTQMLNELLTRTHTLAGLAQRFQRRLAGLIRLPWLMATSSDLVWNSAPLNPSARIVRWYFDHLLDLLPTDPEAAARFARVQNMISGPSALLPPHVIVKVFRQSLRHLH